MSAPLHIRLLWFGLAGFLIVGVWQLLPRTSVVAYSQEVRLEEDSIASIVLKGKVPKGQELEFRIRQWPKHGTLIGPTHALSYRPNADFYGEDHFEFVVLSGSEESSTAWVRLKVTPLNDTPKDLALKLKAERNTPLLLPLPTKDQDQDPLTYHLEESPQQGELTQAKGQWFYQPKPGFLGKDRFRLRMEDLFSQSGRVSVEVEVVPENLPPQAWELQLEAAPGQSTLLALQGQDPESAPLRFEVITQPQHGQLEWREQELFYQPEAGYMGQDAFAYRAFDGEKHSAPAQVALWVRPARLESQVASKLQKMVGRGGLAVGGFAHPDFLAQSGEYVPASTIKIATAAAALHYLGADHHFATYVYLDAQRNLYVKGTGDPSFRAAEWHDLAGQLKGRGIFDQPIQQVILDDSAFVEAQVLGRSQSLKPHDAPLGALASNQNVGEVDVFGANKIKTLDPLTPLTPRLASKARSQGRGRHQFALATTSVEGSLYSLELAQAIFQEYGLIQLQAPKLGSVPKGQSPLLIYHSPTPLEEVIRQMLAESNNFIANQLVMAMALKRFGEPAKLEDGVLLMTHFLEREVGLNPKEIKLVEGAGLSRENKVELVAMLKVMEYFEPHKHLLSDLKDSRYPELASLGSSAKILAKTGTLSDVANLAGYFYTKEQQWKPFVLMLDHSPQKRALVLQTLVDAYN